MGPSRKTVLVGKVTSGWAEIVVVDGLGPPPFPGPWTLRAMIRIPEPPPPGPIYPPTEIH